MHVSTLKLDTFLQRLNPESDRDMHDLAQAVSETVAGLAAALEDMDSRLSDINNRLDQLSVAD